MAKKVWTTPIEPTNKVDWGIGDSTTGNLPLSGGVVQQYIQDNFDSKAGYFYSDASAGKCYVFASREDWENWHEAGDDENSDLIIGTFGITANFTMTIDIAQSESSKSAASGSTGNTITFTWNVKDLRDSSITTEDANCYLTFTNGTVTKSISFRVSGSNHTITQNVDEYLLDGENRIDIMVTGLNSKVSSSRQITYNIIALGLTSSYDISKVWTIDDTLTIPYTLTGSDLSVTEWWWDGIKLSTVSYDSHTILNNVANRTKSIVLKNLTDLAPHAEVTSGVHNMKFRTYVISNGSKFYTDTLYREIIINNPEAELTTPVFTIETTIPKENFDEDNASEPIQLYGLSQYVPYDFTIATYYPGDAASLTTEISIAGMSTVYTEALENNNPITLEIVPSINGSTTLTIKCAESEKTIDLTISENTLGLSELGEEDGLVVSFAADGRTNSSLNKGTWTYGDYKATFSGFEWTETSGWKNGQLLIDNGDSLSLDNYLPFESGDEGNGLTLELEYATNRVLDDTAVLCSTINESGTGIKITATEAMFKSISQTISVKYKSGENVRIAFVIESRKASDKPLLLIYMNGILSGAAVWSSSDSITNNVPIKFVGTEEASIALKQIRGYNRALTSEQILNNYILYRSTFAEMQDLYTKNDIYDEATGLISADKVARYLPVMLITGDIPHVDAQKAEQKSDITIMPEVKYIDYVHNKSFVFRNAGMSCQGTSSMTYPKKNYRLYTEEKKLSKPTWPLNTTWEYDPDHSNFFRMDIDDITNEQNWIEQPWSGKKDGKHKVKYAFRDQGEYENGAPMGATRWTIKADFAESSSTHNTGVARLWNNVMYKAAIGTTHPLRTHAQECALNEALGADIRTCVDGFPIAMFYRTSASSNYTFMGKYNFNNDKSSEEIFGFTDIDSFDDGIIDASTLRDGKYVTYSWEEENDDGVMELVTKECKKYKHTMQCWELTDSANPVSLFKRTSQNLEDLSIEEMGYEARYPDDAGEDAEDKRWRAFVQPFYEWMCDIRDEATITYDENGHISSWTNPSRFTTEKYQWMDVPKMAAYYIYLIRFGAVDQVVKNAMLTSEDGQHFYYINYDNDTIFGLNNYGDLAYGPEITRTSIMEGDTDFAYAARESTLWNCLENDKEFMETIVPQIDEALRVAGLTYDNIIHTFEDEGGKQWCETIYNKDAEYKYIDSYRDGENYLGSMQGARTTHRRWWVSKRFDFYDSLFHNGTYLSKQFIVNLISPKAPYNKLQITAGAHSYYGLYADGTYSNRVELQPGEKAWITVEENVQLGRNNILLSPHNLYEVDLTNCAPYIGKVSLGDAYDEVLGSKMRRLVLGSDDSEPNGQLDYNNFKGLAALANLEYLNVQNYTALTALEGLDQLSYLKEFNAQGSGIKTVSFAKGAPLTKLELPNGIQTLVLSELPLLTTDGIYFDDGGYDNVSSLTIDNCQQLHNSWTWVNKFTNLKTIDLEVDWGETDPIKWDELKAFLNEKSGSLRGTICLSKENLPEDIVEQLYNGEYKQWFGEGVLNKDNKLYISLPKNVYLKLNNYTIVEGLGPYLEDGRTVNPDYDEKLGHTYLTVYYVGFDEKPSIRISTSNAYSSALKIDSDTYEIYAHETYFTSDTDVTLYARFDGGPSSITLKVLNKEYPNASNTTIVGDTAIYANAFGDEFSVKYSDAVKGKPVSIKWKVSSLEPGSQYVTIENDTSDTCILKLGDNGDDKFESMYNINLYLEITNPTSESSILLSKALTISYSEGAIISEASNPELWEALKRGLIAGFAEKIENGIKAFTKTDAEDTIAEDFDASKLYVATTSTDDDGETVTTYSGVTSFNEFQYFTGLYASDGQLLFDENPVLEEITLPNTWRSTAYGLFRNCTNLRSVKLDSGIEDITIGGSTFENCINLTNVDFGDNITTISGAAFFKCTSLERINTTDRLKVIGAEAFYTCSALKEFNITDNITDIGDSAFYACRQVTNFRLPVNASYTTVGQGTFWFCSGITEVDVPDNVTVIEQNAFASTGVRTVNLNKVTSIGLHAFYGANLQELYIPETVTFIGNAAFSGNSGLTEFTGDSVFNPIKYKDTKQGSTYLISDPEDEQSGSGIVTTYTLMQVAGGATSFEMPSDIRKIGDFAFYVCEKIQKISIPDYITSIGKSAFYACSSLNTVILPFGFTTLQESTFGYTRRLTTIYVRSSDGTDTNPGFNDLRSIKTLGWGVFYCCEALPSLYFRDLTSVADSVFFRCLKLGDITVENTTPPEISLGSVNVFGDPDSKLSAYQTLTGAEAAEKVFTIPSGSDEAYQATRWYNLWNPAICEFTLNATL